MDVKKAAISLVTAILLLGAAILIVRASSRATVPAPLVTSATAAVSFGNGNRVGVPGYPVRALASGDLDNDGDPDVVSAFSPADTIDAWENDGSPFSGPWISGSVGSPDAPSYALAIADLDDDGNLDIASGSHASAGFEIVVWRNDSTPFVGTWASNGVMAFDASVVALTMADLDNDGDLDLVSGDSASWVRAWQNDATPFAGFWSLNNVGNTGGGYVRTVAAGDLDNDGDVDIVSGDIADQVIAWQNDGTPFGGGWISQTVFVADGDVASVKVMDLDSDGDLDVAAGCGPSEDYEITTWENDGTPFDDTWVQHDVSAPEGGVYAIAAADLDVDGDLDLASGSQALAAYAEVRTWENSGSPFSGVWSGTDVGETGASVLTVIVDDLDRDGDPDLLGATDVITAWPNTRLPEELGNWTEVARPSLAEDALDVALTDFDYDGKLDLATGTAGHGMQIWRGNGGYAWTHVRADSLPSAGNWINLAWGQIDNSEYLDLAAASDGDGLRAWLVRQVSADWASLDDITGGLPNVGGYKALDLGDVDHDGLLDLVACGKSLGVRSWQGTGGSGSPHWQAKTMLSGTLSFCDVALTHVNHDGDVDLVAASCEGSNAGIAVWRGYGDFSFTLAPPVTVTGSYHALALGDVDNDGDVDVVAAPAGASGVRVWLGDGGYTWTDTGVISPSLAVLSLDLADFDNDGYLDILAGLHNGGVRVWKGDGGASWTDASTNLATTRNYLGVAFGRVDSDANLDVVGAESGSSGARVWTAVEPPPGGWRDFQPYTSPPYVWERSRRVTCTVQVGDAGSGLDVSTAKYCFTRDGGATCVGGWLTAVASGSDETTAPQVITATNVPFDQDSETQNTIQFRIRDMAGFTGTSPLYRVAIDATPPTNPLVVNSTSHTPEVWSDSTNVMVTWTDGADATSGVWGYSYELTDSSSTLPDETTETTGNSGSDSAGTDGQNWYFRLRTVDRAGNGASSAVHVGPFWIDKTYPSNPATLSSSSHTPGVWSNDPTVDVWWTAASDGSGSGIAGYWYSWREFRQSDPLDDSTTDLSLSSDPLSTGDNWYFNLRTRDNVGHRATEALNLGPFYIDTIAPYSIVDSPSTSSSRDFYVSWTAWELPEPQSGIEGVTIMVREKCTTPWNVWLTDQPAIGGATFTGEHGHAYEFVSVASDLAGNVEAWPATPDSTTGVSTLDFEAFGLEVTQAIQDLNNSTVLVADKRTFARFHVRSLARGDQGPVNASLTAWRGGVSLGTIPASNPDAAITVRDDPDRGRLDHSFYFDLPSSWLHGSVTFIAEVNPDSCLAESDYTNNDYTEGVDFQSTPEMNILLVDACYTSGGTTYHVRDDDRRALSSWLRRAYPIHQLNVWWGVFGTCYDSPPNASDVNSDLAWHHSRGLLGDDEDPYTRYYGMVDDGHWRTTTSCWMRGRAHGIPSTVASGPAGRPDRCATWDSDDSYADWYGGHELGHTYGRYHAEFCDAAGGRAYPYPDGDISPTRDESDPDAFYGFDVETLEIYPPSWKELMTYCDNEWPSDFTYEGIRDRMVSESGTAVARVQATAAGEYLAVFGTVYSSTDQVELDTFYRVPDAWDVFGRVPGEYSIRLLDAGEAQLADYPFTPHFGHVDPGPACQTGEQAEEEPGLIAEYVPWVTDTARIAIYHGTQELASREVSAHAPQVTLTAPNGGETLTGDQIAVSWQASDADGDTLEYTLEYSVDDGVHWRALGSGITATSLTLDAGSIPGTDQGRFRVLASDGVNTGQDESDGSFSVPNKAPQAWIISPPDLKTYLPGQSVALIAETIDVEEGTLGDTALSWTSSLSGTVGTGQMLHVTDFVTGIHVITLTAVDGDGSTAVETVTIFVGASPGKIYLPLVLRNVSAP